MLFRSANVAFDTGPEILKRELWHTLPSQLGATKAKAKGLETRSWSKKLKMQIQTIKSGIV